MPERLGILGGTFDPIHRGHLSSALEVQTALGLDRVLFVVSARPPHKQEQAWARPEQRLEMVRLAVKHHPTFEADGSELDRDRPSWTVDTLTEMARRFPDSELWFLIGIDAWAEVDSWHRPEALLRLANIVVTTRPGHPFATDEPRPPFAALDHACYDPAVDAHVHHSGHVLVGHRIRGLEVSSSQVRHRLAHGESIEGLVEPSVAAYITEQRLYLGTH